MRTVWTVPLMAMLMIAVAAGKVDAGYCGAVRLALQPTGCALEPGCGPQQCYTVLKPSRKLVFEPQQVTSYRTHFERVVEPRQVTYTRYVPEIQYREVARTVMKPVWETRTHQLAYTVMKPVWETRTKEIPYTVMKPVWETRTRTYTV
ncbi:MAG TPA: hypothetical protein PKI05_13005, partial [Thermogutta sp.]|nr:hypothetical protein [Thermogutta sp.]